MVATAPTSFLVNHQSAVGYVAPGVTLEIVDEAGRALGADQEGVIRVKAPGAASRYLNDDKASRSVFRDGWFYPGDTGSLSPDGLLFVTGRVSERINAGGVKVAPSVIEDVISSRPEISDVAAFEHVNAEGISEIAVAIVPHENIDRANFNRGRVAAIFSEAVAREDAEAVDHRQGDSPQRAGEDRSRKASARCQGATAASRPQAALV